MHVGADWPVVTRGPAVCEWLPGQVFLFCGRCVTKVFVTRMSTTADQWSVCLGVASVWRSVCYEGPMYGSWEQCIRICGFLQSTLSGDITCKQYWCANTVDYMCLCVYAWNLEYVFHREYVFHCEYVFHTFISGICVSYLQHLDNQDNMEIQWNGHARHGM